MIEVRDLKPSDLNFIYHSWLKTIRPNFKDVSSATFYSSYKREVETMIQKSKIKIAFDPKEENLIFGYLVYQEVDGLFMIHHAYVKSSFRRFGIFKDLIKSIFPNLGTDPIYITYKNDRALKIGEKYKFIFRPELRSL